MKKSLIIFIFIWALSPKAYSWSPYGDYTNSFVNLATSTSMKDVDQEPTKTSDSANAAVPVAPSPSPQETATEVVGSTAPGVDEGLLSSPRPRQRPRLETAAKPPPQQETKASTNLRLYDVKGCKYGKGFSANGFCYKNMSDVDRANRILSAIQYVNSLHDTNFDGRYMLCTGYRESNFNPGALGRDGERGMFQVMRATGRAALRYGPKVPEFSKMSSEEYMKRMATSTAAQVELSFLTLEMKLVEDGNKARKSRIMSGSGTVEDFRYMAGRYNGGGYNSVYAKRIANCYSCLRGKIKANATSVDSTIKTCLNKAK